jgi:hypothetical protein
MEASGICHPTGAESAGPGWTPVPSVKRRLDHGVGTPGAGLGELDRAETGRGRAGGTGRDRVRDRGGLEVRAGRGCPAATPPSPTMAAAPPPRLWLCSPPPHRAGPRVREHPYFSSRRSGARSALCMGPSHWTDSRDAPPRTLR